MTDFNRTESARWAIESQKAIGELQDGREKVLAEAAGRGFPAAPGVTLAIILSAGQAVKDKLTEANGKIYEDRRKVIFEQDEFAMKVIVQISKLAMEFYRDELLNALALETAEKDALRDRGNADVIAMNAEIDKRQVAIIQARAEMERRITVLKAQLVVAEEGTLDFEAALINAQVVTAEKKLEIIDSIYQVLAAEELVLEAENRRVAVLEQLLVAQKIVVGLKQEMIPFYQEKSQARQELTGAITKEIPVKIAIEELGYERIYLEDEKERVSHEIRQAEEEFENIRMVLTRATKTTELAKTKSKRLLQEYTNYTKFLTLIKKKESGRTEGERKYFNRLIDITNKFSDERDEMTEKTKLITKELTSIINNLQIRAADEASKVDASATRNSQSGVTHLISRKIIEGAF